MPAPLNVLLVDDDALLRLTVGRRLEGKGWTVCQASSGQAALDQLELRQFDLILSDVMMPGMDGLQLTAEARERGIEVPIALMSGLASPEMAERAVALGAAMLVAKPLADAALEQIEAAARGARSRPATTSGG